MQQSSYVSVHQRNAKSLIGNMFTDSCYCIGSLYPESRPLLTRFKLFTDYKVPRLSKRYRLRSN